MPKPTEAAYLQAIRERDEARRERDEAIAERDYLVDFFIDLGEAVSKSRELNYRPTVRGVHLRVLYPTLADAVVANGYVRHLRSMLSIAPRKKDALAKHQARIAGSQLSAS
jgi:hypothetical protein